MRAMTADRLAALQRATLPAVLEGPGQTRGELRRRIACGEAPPGLAPLVGAIRGHAHRGTDADIGAQRARYSEEHLFEVIVPAALGATEHRLARALAAVEQACD